MSDEPFFLQPAQKQPGSSTPRERFMSEVVEGAAARCCAAIEYYCYQLTTPAVDPYLVALPGLALYANSSSSALEQGLARCT
jgi:hypothetical protein